MSLLSTGKLLYDAPPITSCNRNNCHRPVLSWKTVCYLSTYGQIAVVCIWSCLVTQSQMPSYHIVLRMQASKSQLFDAAASYISTCATLASGLKHLQAILKLQAFSSSRCSVLQYCSAASSSNPLLNPAAIQALFQATNFIGISAYPAYTPGSLQGFEDTIMSFVWEIKWLGVDVANLVNVQGKEFILSEYGIGGGSNQNGAVPARTADVVSCNRSVTILSHMHHHSDITLLCPGRLADCTCS
eukprot:GHUV01035336.1.p1 GENE.GHUV01035336.1~~GHUV01035336.1.p1  ORF type:complete len:243 (-),score=30.40 GHUV01035336.1:27-755(-)